MKTKSKHKIRYKTISLPEKLYNKVDGLIENTAFANVSQFIAFLLRMILSEGTTTFDREMEEKIKVRLRTLGYL